MDAVQIEKALKTLVDKPTLKNFIEKFWVFVQGPDAVPKLKTLIFSLSVVGNLSKQANDETSSGLINASKEKRKCLIKAKTIRNQRIKNGEDVENAVVLPEYWTWCQLGYLGNVFNGNSINKREKETLYEGIECGYPYVATKDVGYVYDEIEYYNDVKIPFEKEGFKVAKKGAVIICSEGGSAGKKLGITQYDICFGNKLYAFESYGFILPEYIRIYYLSKIFANYFKSRMTGIIGGISINKFISIPVPVPPLQEQRNIISKVAELMTLCDQLEAQQQQQANTLLKCNTAAIHALLSADSPTLGTGSQNTKKQKQQGFDIAWQRIANNFHTLYGNTLPMPTGEGRQKKYFVGLENVKQLKQLIFQLGTTGLLVQSYKCNNAGDDLKEIGIKSSIDKSPSRIPKNWVWVSLGDLSQLITSGSRGWKSYYSDSGNTFIRSQDIKFDKLLIDNKAYVSLPKKTEGKRAKVSNGDLLITITGANVGKCALVRDLSETAYVSQHVALVKLHSIIYTDYLHKWLTNGYGGREMLIGDSYGDKPGLNLKQISSLVVPFPPIEEQKRIVAKVDQLMALCDQLEQQLTTAYDDAEKLINATIKRLVA